MTVKEAYKNYYRYCRDSETWTWDFIKDNLKKTYIDFEEFNFEEFKDKILTDDKFNARWANGCTRELSLEERYEIMQANIKTATLGKPSSYDSLYYDSKNIPTKTIIN